MAKHKTKDEWLHIARVERDLTGGVTLHLIRDDEAVELHQDDEFLTVVTTVDPFNPTPADAADQED